MITAHFGGNCCIAPNTLHFPHAVFFAGWCGSAYIIITLMVGYGEFLLLLITANGANSCFLSLFDTSGLDINFPIAVCMT